MNIVSNRTRITFGQWLTMSSRKGIGFGALFFCSATNAGDSAMLNLTYSPTPMSTMLSMNGMRQPNDWNHSGLVDSLMVRNTRLPVATPAATPHEARPANKPRNRGG